MPLFDDAKVQLVNPLDEQTFVWFPVVCTGKCIIITAPCHQPSGKAARLVQWKSHLVHIFFLLLYLRGQTQSLVNHATRIWEVKAVTEGFKCFNSVFWGHWAWVWFGLRFWRTPTLEAICMDPDRFQAESGSMEPNVSPLRGTGLLLDWSVWPLPDKGHWIGRRRI